MRWYTSLISSHPVVIIVAVGVFSVSCILISLTSIKLPNFSDPQLGFEARGTEISNRLTAWQNLQEAIRPSGPLTVNPLGDVPPSIHHQMFHSKNIITESKEAAKNKTDRWNDKGPGLAQYSNSTGVVNEGNHNHSKHKESTTWAELVRTIKEKPVSNVEDEDAEEGREHFHDDHNHLAKDGFFCASGPGPEFSRVVVSVDDKEEDLLSLSGLQRVCRLQQYLASGPLYSSLCEQARHGQCCQPWSLPNYVAMLHNRSSCHFITEEDVRQTRELLENCSHLYYNLHLMPDMGHKEGPTPCHKHNAVYNLMHYILDNSFIPPKINESSVLKNTVIFLPMARSSDALDFYQALENSQLREDSVYVSAIDFGLKNTLFDCLLIRDTWLIAMGALFVLGCMWLYTGSLFITLMTIVAIAFSLGIAYFIYSFIFELYFFPFMNILATIVAVGIGADDAFILCKVWQCTKAENCNLTMDRLVQITMKHSALSMFVTTITTAAAFFSSYISAITAIRCFSVFVGTAVIVNYGLMVTWLPACIVVSERICWAPLPLPSLAHPRRIITNSVSSLNSLLVSSVLRLKYVCLSLLTLLALASVVVVCYWPRLRLPDSADFQLFVSSHPFEQYDYFYKDKFWFERPQKVDTGDNTNAQMPLRFVWGVVPEDNGNYLDPASRGTLRFDPKFDMAAPDSQTWLLKFCRNLKTQPFFEMTLGPLLPNCFIESFVDWMNRRCQDPVDRKSRAPCCESARFPFTRRVFNQCLREAIASLYRTPRELFTPGVAGPKFSRTPNIKNLHKVKAVVVEYDSNFIHSTSYTEMDTFFKQVESWSQEQMAEAPPGMRNGFFVSQLAFYDLQRTLAQDTVLAIVVSLAVSLAVLLMVTLNLLVSLYTILSIMWIIFVTVAILVLIGWKLNVLESVAVSVAIGLAVDFSLHYAVNYRMCLENDSRESCVSHSLHIMAGPSLMAALTTAAAGALMLPSTILPYIQIGVFLVVVMVVSWLYSTYFLMCLLAVVGPQRNFGQLSYPELRGLLKKRADSDCPGNDRTVYVNVLSESNLSTSSTMCALHSASGETHELETLTRHPCRHSRRIRRSGSVSQSSSRKVSLPADQSPSATSATTIIHDDDCDLPPS